MLTLRADWNLSRMLAEHGASPEVRKKSVRALRSTLSRRIFMVVWSKYSNCMTMHDL